MDAANRKKRLVILISLLLSVGFLATSLVSYFMALASLRDQIETSSLPLTSDNVYSEIQRDLIRPIFISSFMANDTFLRDWVTDGEKDADKITRYLKQVMTKYGTFTSFFVSEATRIYYHADGILKKVDAREERDVWYFRVREMEPDYEINVDPDMANRDAMTIFINHRVHDYQGRYIGVAGVGLKVSFLVTLMDQYSRRYDRRIYLTDTDGNIQLSSMPDAETVRNIRDIEGLSSIADAVLSTEVNRHRYVRQGKTVHLNSRFVSELKWYLLVEQTEEGTTGTIHSALVINILVCALITAIVLIITNLSINAYQKTNQAQHAKIVQQHEVLLDKNDKLEIALAEVKRLSGLLPICSSCKKIRNDEGYWQQIELYIRDHSEADFSHGICPDCARRLYGALLDEEIDQTD